MRRTIKILAAVLFTTALWSQSHPHTVDRSVKLDLNGKWVDAAGREWTATQKDDYVTLTTKTGRTFQGQLSGHSLSLFHELAFDETNKTLPVPVRQMIVGERTTFAGTVSEDGQSIDAEYIDKDPDWLFYPDTGKYEIKKLIESQRGVKLSRPAEIHIAHIYVDYENGRQRIRELQNELNDLERELQALGPLLSDAQVRVRTAQPPVDAARAQCDALKKQIDQVRVADDVQLQIDYLEALKYFQQLQDTGINHSDPKQQAILTQAVEDKNALRKRLQSKRINVPAAGTVSSTQIQQRIDALEAQIKTAKDQRYALEDQLLLAEGEKTKVSFELDLALAAVTRLVARVAPLREKKDEIAAELKNVRKDGDPQLQQVDVSGPDGAVYHADWWDPHEGLDATRQTLDQVEAALRETESQRDQLKQLYESAKQDEFAAGAAIPAALYKSAFAQWGTEVADFALDVIKNSRKEGLLVGAGHAVLKKAFDIAKDYAILKAEGALTGTDKGFADVGGYVFLDEEQIRQEMAKQWKPEEGAWEYATGTGYPIAKQFLVDKAVSGTIEKGVYSGGQKIVTKAGARALRWELNNVGKVVDLVSERFKSVDGFVKEIGGKGVIDGVEDLVKDYWKAKGKQAAAESFEGSAWKAYYNAEFKRLALHEQWAGAQLRCEALQDQRLKVAAIRDGIMQQYDQNKLDYYHGKESAALKQKKDYSFALKFSGAQPTKVELHMGNAEGAGGPAAFQVNTRTMQGDVDVHVKVISY